MDTIKHSIAQLSEHFDTQMAEFQKVLQNSSTIPAASPTSNITSQFNTFRNFVLSSLEALKLQVDLLTKNIDQMEMRSRQKILLIHGVSENKKEDVTTLVTEELSKHMKISALTATSISRCHRMGAVTPSSSKTRPILVKYRDLALRNQVWFAKTNLKNTGITISEFLTKERHSLFMAARQRLGVSKCWTKDGRIFLVAPNGKRHQITSLGQLDDILNCSVEVQQQSSSSGVSTNLNLKDNKVPQLSQINKPRRTAKK